MTKKALAITKKENRIAPWGDRAEVREIARRVQLMAPGAKKLSENEALALAQGAVAHGLDPFNGEIWYIPGSGLMTGIKGLRKAARQQIEGNFWTEFDEIVDPDERNLYMIPEGALAFRCTVRDSETIRSYSEAWKRLSEDGVPIELIPDILGQRPFTLGVGYIKDGEKTKMDPIQVAMKRAEADAIKRRFDLPFAVPTEPNEVSVIDGNWAEAGDEDQSDSPSEGVPNIFTGERQELPPLEQEVTQDTKPADPDPEDPPPTIETLRELAVKEPHNIGATQYWTVSNHFGVDREQGQAIYKELGNWADALIYLVEQFSGPEKES